MPAFESKLICV